jgi:hypothetical protein
VRHGADIVDYVDDRPERLAIAEKFGARVHSVKKGKRTAADIPRRDYDVAVEGTASAVGVDLALRSLAPGGVCQPVGFYLPPRTKVPLMHMYVNDAALKIAVSSVRPVLPDLLNFVANDDYRALLNVVEFIDPSALVERQVTDLVEVCGYADDLAGGLVKIANGANIASGNGGGSRSHAGAFRRNVLKIAVSQIVLAQGRETALHDRSAPRPDEHHVFADGVELLPISGAESFTQAHQQQKRTDAPCNPKHREE